MPDPTPFRTRKTSPLPSVIAYAVLALLFLAGSLIPYSSLVSWMSRLLSDGIFESLSAGEYLGLQRGVRAVSLLLLAAAGIQIAWPERFEAARDQLKAIRAKAHLRKEMQGILRATFPAEDRSFLFTLGLITLLGLAIRLIDYAHPVGYDEAYTYIHFASKSLRTILADYSAPNNHIFHTLLVALADRIFGNYLWVLRLPALIAGVLCIPAVYAAGRSLYNRGAGILSAALLCLAPLLVDYSTNARGYSLICLFSLLMLWQAGILRRSSTFSGWLLLGTFATLGFYTIPVMVYPVCGVYLWLLLSWLIRDTFQSDRRHFIYNLLSSAVGTILMTLVLYTPVFLFGTGLSSITGNEFVRSQTWGDFIQSVAVRIPTVWSDWNSQVPPALAILIAIGMLASLLLEWKQAAHRMPPWLAVVLAVSLLLIAQRVAPLTRVWLFLLCFYLLFSANGWQMLFHLAAGKLSLKRYLTTLTLGLLTFAVFWGFWSLQSHALHSDQDVDRYRAPAQFTASILNSDDTLVSVSPISIQVGYYLAQEGVPFSRFFDKVRRGEIKHAIIILSNHSKFPTVQSVVDFQLLQTTLDATKAELLFEHGYLQVFSVPVLTQP
jgi:hypothetical protein